MPEYFGVSNHRVSSLLSNGWKNRVYESVFKETMIEQMGKMFNLGVLDGGHTASLCIIFAVIQSLFQSKKLNNKTKIVNSPLGLRS